MGLSLDLTLPPNRFYDLVQINTFSEESTHGVFHVAETNLVYFDTFVHFIIFLFRLRDEHEPLQQHEFFTSQGILLLFLSVLKPFPIPRERFDHPVAWFVHIMSTKSSYSDYPSLEYLSHLVVHLIYATRICVFKALKPLLDNYTRESLLEFVRMRLLSYIFKFI